MPGEQLHFKKFNEGRHHVSKFIYSAREVAPTSEYVWLYAMSFYNTKYKLLLQKTIHGWRDKRNLISDIYLTI